MTGAIFQTSREDGRPGRAVWLEAPNGGQVLVGNFDDEASAEAEVRKLLVDEAATPTP